MTSDRPPAVAERQGSCCKESCSVSTSPQVVLRMMKLSFEAKQYHQDESPMKPLRRWNAEADGTAETSESGSITNSRLPPPAFDEPSDDHSAVFSDITDPSAFASMDASSSLNSSFNTSFNNIDASWRNDSLDTSLRIENLGPLQEELDDNDSFELTVRKPPSSSSMDNVFESSSKDMPPQVAVRCNVSVDWTIASRSMDDRFDEMIGPDDQDQPMSLPRPSYSQQEEEQRRPMQTGLQKRAEAFMSGCVTGTHRYLYQLKKYPNTFVGSQAVDFMLNANLASTREDAVFLGQRFCKELNLFHHVHWDHTFKDGQFLYRFNGDAVRCGTLMSRADLVVLSQKLVDGIPVSKHKSRRFKTYRNTFSGKQAVDYLLQSKLASTRSDAIFLGQRMMEELDVLEPISNNSRFKDSYHLYRFVTGNDNASTSEASSALGSSMDSFGAQDTQYTSRDPLPNAKSQGCYSLQSSKSCSALPTTIGKKEEKRKVTFGMVQSRHFERRLECNPATTSGPSLGLGWRFYDDSPVSLLSDENAGALELRIGRLSIQDRTSILKDWGYNKLDISRVTRLNKTMREKRKRSSY